MRSGELLSSSLFQGDSSLLALPDEPSDRPVCFPKGHPLRCQVIGKLRRQHEATRRLCHAGTVEGGGAQHLREHREYAEDRVNRVEEGLFVLLKVLRIPQGESLEGDEQGVQVTDEASGFAAHQLAGVEEVQGKIPLGDGVERVDQRLHVELCGCESWVDGVWRSTESCGT